MDDFTTSLMAQINRATENVIDSIAKDGLVALKSVLDDAGFGEYESLKTYEVFVHVMGKIISFEIQVEFDSLDEDTKKKITNPPVDQRDEQIRRTARTYAISGIGGMTKRVVGRRDARTPVHDARKRIHDARRPAREVSDARKGAEERLAEHTFASAAPRGMSITQEGKLSVALEKTVEDNDKGVRFPQGDFQGILGKFVQKLQKVVAEQFSPQLEQILLRGMNR